MQFIIYSEDKADSLPLRQANREAHLAWLSQDMAAEVLVAGPWLDNDGTMRGSLLIVECEDAQTLEGWMARDPYAKAGLPSHVIVRPYKWVIGAPSR